MTDSGLTKILIAKETGVWNLNTRPQMSLDIPSEFAEALAQNEKARENFDKLSPSYRKQYIYWIGTAKRLETKKKRIEESIALLAEGKKLGLK